MEIAAGRELRQELQGVAKELKAIKEGESPQVQDRGGQAIRFQGDFPELAAKTKLNCR